MQHGKALQLRVLAQTLIELALDHGVKHDRLMAIAAELRAVHAAMGPRQRARVAFTIGGKRAK